MASTNINTDNQNILSTDIYEIAEFLDQVRRDNIPNLDETSSIVGIFGYMNEMFSQTLQNALVVISETTNETIPTRAKFTKNIISHAMNLGITDICATPAVMTMMIYLPISYIEANFIEGKPKFILSKDCPILVGGHEFHLDYDIIFTRIKNPQDNYVYTAMYDLFETGTTQIKQSNPISDITNPYITTLIQCTLDNTDFLAFSARLHQVTRTTIEKNILTSNPIENKAVTFEFNDQLASFDIDVIENNNVTHLTPVYSGLIDYTIPDGSWCYYNYINENTIRILFSKDSYVPSMNALVKINIQTSEGSNGNFTYNNSFKTSLKSEAYNNYNGMYAYIYPLLNGVSNRGKDKKSILDLKKIIPREASSRGAVINTTDLNNFFNSINDDECKLYFKKKKDNQFERMYYSYMLMRKNGYVYPTNTLDARLIQSDFKGFSGNNNLVISPGTKFYYYDHGALGEDDAFATINKPKLVEGLDEEQYPYDMTINEDGNMVRVFEYVTPFLISVDDDLVTSYFLTCMNENKTFAFDSINTESDLQFVATNMLWKRNYLFTDNDGDEKVYDYKYTMDVTMTQNSTADSYKLIKYHNDSNGNKVYDDIRIRMIMVLYADETETSPYRYVEANLVEFDPSNYIYTFRFTLGTDDLMDLNNRINITGIYNCKPEAYQYKSNMESSHGYLNKNTYAKIFILADFGTKVGDELADGVVTEESAEIILYGKDEIGNRTELEKILPIKNDIIKSFLNNDIYLDKNGEQLNVVTIIKHNPEYMEKVKTYNNNDQETETMILRYLRNNAESDFVQNILLKDEDVIEVIESYNYDKNLDRYTLCNVMSVDGGIDFYHDYSSMMRSTVTVQQIQKTIDTGIITAIGEGSAIITATTEDGEYNAICNVEVVKSKDQINEVLNPIDETETIPTNGLYIKPTSITLAVGETAIIAPTLLPSNNTSNLNIIWTSDNTNIVTVDKKTNPISKEIQRTDSLGNNYIEYKPMYLINENGTYHYNYEVKRIPLLRNNYLNTEESMQEFIFDLEERRKYIEECLYILEDTFDIDFKFFNTYGPSKIFYYNIPSSQNYKVRIAVQDLKVLSNTADEDDESTIKGWLHFGNEVTITKVRGQWGYINNPYEGWIKLADTTKVINYIDNVALTMKFALEAQTSADKYISDDIILDIKEYIEDINNINELHIPNIITLITNNYREQLVYFEFMDVNNYGAACQHLYLDEKINADICPEFLNIDTTIEGIGKPNITIAVY